MLSVGVGSCVSPLELVNASVVTRVTRRVEWERGSPAIVHLVTVSVPGNGTVVFLSTSHTAWRRVAKRAGLKLLSKAAKSAAAALRERIEAAVAEERGRPEAARLDSAAMERYLSLQEKLRQKKARELRQGKRQDMRDLMREFRFTLEEVTEAWHESVLADVMDS